MCDSSILTELQSIFDRYEQEEARGHVMNKNFYASIFGVYDMFELDIDNPTVKLPSIGRLLKSNLYNTRNVYETNNGLIADSTIVLSSNKENITFYRESIVNGYLLQISYLHFTSCCLSYLPILKSR